MRRWIIRQALRLVQWLDPTTVLIAVPTDAVYRRAVELVLVEDGRRKASDASGEQRRHQVIAALHKQFPASSWRSLARAIEAAVEA